MHFSVGNIGTLYFERESFDTILSIDSIFFGKDIKTTLARLKDILRVNGQMVIFYSGDLSASLKENNLSYETYDFSKEHYEHMQLKHKVARELQKAFEEESNTFIWENIMTESNGSTTPYDPVVSSTVRYLYHVKKT